MRQILAPVIALLISIACQAQDSNPADEKAGAGNKITTLIQKLKPSLATLKVRGRDGDQLQMGTGFVIEPDGLIVTNFHVIGEGRRFTVVMSSGRQLKVLSVEASDRNHDLALIRVDVGEEPLPALNLSTTDVPPQGTHVLALGNPLGLENSVVTGIVSAIREVEGRNLIQLAIPVERGNSGGPLVDESGDVVGVINMKSSIDDNLGFAIPISQLQPLREKPNPVLIDRWSRLGRISDKKWTPLMGATWQDKGGVITARGMGSGFGGRSLCLSTETMPEKLPFEITVQVKLDSESGAAGLAFFSDGADRHYGFYPSAGRMRLTCFKGPSVYQWEVLEELECEHYVPNQWNRIRVRVEEDRFQCFVNGHLLVESTDRQLTSGRFGLVKFRDTKPDFKSFRVGPDVSGATVSPEAAKILTDLTGSGPERFKIDPAEVSMLGAASEVAARKLLTHAAKLEAQAARLRGLAADVEVAPILERIRDLMANDSDNDQRLLVGALLIAKLDNLDLDVDSYVNRVGEMADEITESNEDESEAAARRSMLHQYLFEENGFQGGRNEYYHPANSHLNRVIDDREGLPITLSILYMELGRQLGLKLQGVGLPGHFVVKHITDDNEQLIDVFEKGSLLTKQDARRIVLAYAGRQLTNEDLRGQSTQEILSRVLNNLMGLASERKDTEAINRYCEALVAIDPESAEPRMLRSQIRAMTDRRVGAIADLSWLLERNPAGFDARRGQRMLEALQEAESKDHSSK
ncbi:MAG: transglutaminase family protein [Rubripirellula sp.]